MAFSIGQARNNPDSGPGGQHSPEVPQSGAALARLGGGSETGAAQNPVDVGFQHQDDYYQHRGTGGQMLDFLQDSLGGCSQACQAHNQDEQEWSEQMNRDNARRFETDRLMQLDAQRDREERDRIMSQLQGNF